MGAFNATRDIECRIRWKDCGEEEWCIIRIDPECEWWDDYPDDDDDILYYCTSEQDFASLCTDASPADFVVVEHG